MNREWHQEHVLGQHASLDDRVDWHLGHARACACREMPASIRLEIEARGLEVPAYDGAPGDVRAP